MPTTTKEKLTTMISGLQSLVEFMNEHEKFNSIYPYKLNYSVHVSDKAEFSKLARLLVGGKSKLNKVYDDYSCTVKRDFSDMVSLSVSIMRDRVCERIVTGKKIVKSVYIPEHEEEIVEWKCK